MIRTVQEGAMICTVQEGAMIRTVQDASIEVVDEEGGHGELRPLQRKKEATARQQQLLSGENGEESKAATNAVVPRSGGSFRPSVHRNTDVM